jgi:hypothetical protein
MIRVYTFAALLGACTPAEEKEADECGERVGVWEGDLTAQDIPGFCDCYSERSIEGDLSVEGTGRPDLSELSCLTSVGETVRIIGNPSLRTLAPLSRLSSLGGCLRIANSETLTTLSGLEGLTSTGDCFITSGPPEDRRFGVSIVGNPLLTSLSGLGSLASTSGDLEIHGNGSLLSLSGLDAFQTIEGKLSIDNNIVLVDVTALHGLTGVGLDVIISDNPSLPHEAAVALANEIDLIGGTVSITGNSP